MTVYIDQAQNPFGRTKMCHMLADTLDELHQMADKLELKREWFQDTPGHPHYDLSLSKRRKAIELGAVMIDNRQMLELLRSWRSRS